MADPTLIMGGVQAGLSIISSLIQAGQTARAREELMNLPIPDASKFYLDEKLMEAARVQDPDIFTSAAQGPSAMEAITEDPRLRAAQMQEIAGLEQLAETGFTPQMEADIMRAQQGLGTTLRGAREAILQSMAQRGMAGSGLEMAQRAAAGQAATQAAATQGADIAARREASRMQALQGLGAAGGRVRGQEWGQKAQVGTAADEIAARNIAARNQAQQFNIQQQQAARAQRAEAAMREAQARADAEKAAAQMEMQKGLAVAGT
jgi:hypothetical protein